MKLSEIGEFGLIDRLAKIIGKPSSKVIIGVGDDAAVLEIPGSRLKIQNRSKNQNHKYLLITTDTLIENIHFKLPQKNGRNREFILRRDPFFLLGKKALAVNISDIAAMGGVPTFAVVTIGAPSGFSVERIVGLYKGIKAEAVRHQVSIVGGDTVRSPRELIISITLLGEVEKDNLLTRSGAKAGDMICVTGKFGGPASHKFDIRYSLPKGRLKEAQTIARSRLAHSLIDSSDGLVRSVIELCKASKVGARIWEEKVPVASGATLAQALYGGEEYELVFTVPKAKLSRLNKVKFSIVGEIVPRSEKSSPATGGYEHFKVIK